MAKRLASWIGIIAFVAGVFAFIPNPIVGTNAFFASNAMTGAVDIILGIIFIYVAYKDEKDIGKLFKIVGIVATAVAAISFLIAASTGTGSFLGISFNDADCWVALVAGIAMITFAEKISSKTKNIAPVK